MPDDDNTKLTVAALFAEREALRARDREADAKLQKNEDEREKEFKQRLDSFQMTDALRQSFRDRIKRAFERGETEYVIVTFPVGFCNDDGRAIANIDEPPINKPPKQSNEAGAEPPWLGTLPHGAEAVYDFWKAELKPGGFGFGARIADFIDGKPGHVSLFFSWPRNPADVTG